MSEAKRKEFNDLVKAAHDAIDEFAEGRVSGDWFQRDLDGKARKAVEKLLSWGLAQERPLRITAPLPSSIVLEDTEEVREYVDGQVAQAIADMVDKPT